VKEFESYPKLSTCGINSASGLTKFISLLNFRT